MCEEIDESFMSPTKFIRGTPVVGGRTKYNIWGVG